VGPSLVTPALCCVIHPPLGCREQGWSVREPSIRIWTDHGSWPYLVKQGCSEVLHRFPTHEKARNTALLLRSHLSRFFVEVPGLPTSPNMAKSPDHSAKFSDRGFAADPVGEGCRDFYSTSLYRSLFCGEKAFMPQPPVSQLMVTDAGNRIVGVAETARPPVTASPTSAPRASTASPRDLCRMIRPNPYRRSTDTPGCAYPTETCHTD
jgi:hypothetical protein